MWLSKTATKSSVVLKEVNCIDACSLGNEGSCQGLGDDHRRSNRQLGSRQNDIESPRQLSQYAHMWSHAR